MISMKDHQMNHKIWRIEVLTNPILKRVNLHIADHAIRETDTLTMAQNAKVCKQQEQKPWLKLIN